MWSLSNNKNGLLIPLLLAAMLGVQAWGLSKIVELSERVAKIETRIEQIWKGERAR